MSLTLSIWQRQSGLARDDTTSRCSSARRPTRTAPTCCWSRTSASRAAFSSGYWLASVDSMSCALPASWIVCSPPSVVFRRSLRCWARTPKAMRHGGRPYRRPGLIFERAVARTGNRSRADRAGRRTALRLLAGAGGVRDRAASPVCPRLRSRGGEVEGVYAIAGPNRSNCTSSIGRWAGWASRSRSVRFGQHALAHPQGPDRGAAVRSAARSVQRARSRVLRYHLDLLRGRRRRDAWSVRPLQGSPSGLEADGGRCGGR